MNDLTGELLALLVATTQERKADALKILKGEAIVADPVSCQPLTAPILLGMGTAAKYLGVSRATLWRMIKAKRLERVDLFTGTYRVRKTDLEDFACGKTKFDAALGEAPRGASRRGRGRPPKSVQSSASGQADDTPPSQTPPPSVSQETSLRL
jgi:excisionase family DNA binding protein